MWREGALRPLGVVGGSGEAGRGEGGQAEGRGAGGTARRGQHTLAQTFDWKNNGRETQLSDVE